MAVALRSGRVSHSESIFRKPVLLAVIPVNLRVLAVCVFALFSIRHIEQVIGTLRTAGISLVAHATDSFVRTFLRYTCDFEIPASHPYAPLTTLVCLYCIFLPRVRAHSFAVNEKVLLLFMLLLVALLDNVRSGILISLRFLLFPLLGPLCYSADCAKKN
jgi:hypothetical protein